MLYEFLQKNEVEILALAEEKTLKLAGSLPSSEKLKIGLPVFYKHLIEYLKGPTHETSEKYILDGASLHGKELQKLNYTVSHVVHAYGAMCQAITELAQRRNENISSKEFNELNMCLDYAISSAVSSFQFVTTKTNEDRELQHIGSLVHELRNSLSSATIAHEMIKKGFVGTSGSTARVLEENLSRMRNLIDRSLSEIRMRTDPVIISTRFNLLELIDQIILTAQTEARIKKQILSLELTQDIFLETDRYLLLSAIANLVQNAIKYSKFEGRIILRAGIVDKEAVIEIEDECGGLKSGEAENIFKPFVSSNTKSQGLGLGLTISRRAVELLNGKISALSNSGNGCAFLIHLPLKYTPKHIARAVPGEDSAQPNPVQSSTKT
jgi:signal transduction histidine kinase